MKTPHYNLFLDDERDPQHVHWKHEVEYTHYRWVVVRTAAQFIAQLVTHGIPAFVSFDNDIQDFTGKDGKEITGYDMAKMLCYFCIDNNIKFPKVVSHSKNVVDQPKIEAIFKNATYHHPHLKNA